jgi:hypothetical protein
MLRGRSSADACEICLSRPATRTTTFTAHFLQANPTPLLVEEQIAKMGFRKRICNECAQKLRTMTNVTDLAFEEM